MSAHQQSCQERGLHPAVPTADVRLAPLTREHAQRMLAWVRDPLIRLHVGLRGEPSLQRTLQWIDHATTDPSYHPFAILYRDDHVGNIVLDRIDHHLGTTRLSVYIGEAAARGQRVGQAALRLVLAEAFVRQGLHKVWLTVHTRNHAAIAAYQRLGFVVEGILRDEFLLEGQRVDALYMGLLAREFTAATLCPVPLGARP